MDGLKNKKVEPSVKQFYNSRKNISMLNGMLLKMNKIIVSTNLRGGEVRNLIHSGYEIIEKCIFRAREHVCWPSATAEINDMVSNCSTCHDEIGTSIFELDKNPDMIAVDYTTKFFDIHSLTDNPPLLSCILRACLQNLVFHRLSLVTMNLNLKQMNSKYLLRISISNITHPVFSIHNPMVLWNEPYKSSNTLWRRQWKVISTHT